MARLEVRFWLDGRLLKARPAVSTLDAKAQFSAWRDAKQFGGSRIGGAVIYRDSVPIARLSYNGRAWEPHVDWPHAKEIDLAAA